MSPFDLKGWIAIPGVLSAGEIDRLKAHVIAQKEDPESLDPLERYAVSGPLQMLVDHPVVVGVLREILAQDRSEDCYGFRCENGFTMVRGTDFKGTAPAYNLTSFLKVFGRTTRKELIFF